LCFDATSNSKGFAFFARAFSLGVVEAFFTPQRLWMTSRPFFSFVAIIASS
jgi:hypothetical protein